MRDKAEPKEMEAIFASLTLEEQLEAQSRARRALQKMLGERHTVEGGNTTPPQSEH